MNSFMKRSLPTTLLVLMVTLVTVMGSVGTTRTMAASPDALQQSSERTLLFSDEFDASQLDQSKWTTCFWWETDGCTIRTNNELEWYQPDDVIVDSGILRLRAQERTIDATIPNSPTHGESEVVIYQYTSGMISTGRDYWETTAPIRFEYKYGYAEMRARIPSGTGLWPAFWMISSDHEWPPEIDAMEILGNDPTTTHMNVHYLDSQGNHGSYGEAWSGIDFSEGWHTFGVDWQPYALTWYVDGVARASTTDPAHIPTGHLYLVANLAVGGNWPGAPDAATLFPSFFEIDYIKVWDVAPSSEPPTATPTPTSTPVPTDTATPTPTSTPVPTDTATPTPTSTPVPADTATPTPTSTLAPTNTATPTETPDPFTDPSSGTYRVFLPIVVR